MVPTREIHWNIVGESLIYLLALVAALFLAFGILRRVRLWRLGGGATRLERWPERLGGVLAEVFGHRRLVRDPTAGTAHLLVFYGFLAALVATTLIAVQEWTGIHFLQGRFYLGYSLLSDGFGILALIGIGVLLWRRAIRRPARLHSVPDDWVLLGLLLLLFLQGFLVEGIRIAVTELHQHPDLARWSPGGYLVALALPDANPERLRGWHRVLWWLHAATAFGFLGYVAFGKFNHVWFGALNVFLRNLDPSGKLTHPDIEAALETDPDSLETLGIDRIDGYSWKSLLDLDACMNCGRCEAVCPAHLSGVALSPRKLIRDLKDHLDCVGPRLLEARSRGDDGALPASGCGLPRLFGETNEGVLPPAVLEEELWGCRTCGACQRECPVCVEHVPKMIDMRRHLVMTESRMPEGVQGFLKNLDDRMHPWVGGGQDREAWFADLDVRVCSRGGRAELLFWIGCTGALVERNVAVTRALARLLNTAGVDFAVLGAEEVCTGDPARRVGGELSFQTCAKQNIETFERYGVRRVVTACPHCFNTLKNEYPDFGGRYEVFHHTQLLGDLIRSGRLPVNGGLDSLTYHDPCYLGRHNQVYRAPREVLTRLSGSGGFRDLPRSRSESLCCGAGGGYAWMDDEPRTRINRIRLEEIRASGARTAAVSCPFCLQMLGDAVQAAGAGGAVRIADVAELVAEAVEE